MESINMYTCIYFYFYIYSSEISQLRNAAKEFFLKMRFLPSLFYFMCLCDTNIRFSILDNVIDVIIR